MVGQQQDKKSPRGEQEERAPTQQKWGAALRSRAQAASWGVAWHVGHGGVAGVRRQQRGVGIVRGGVATDHRKG